MIFLVILILAIILECLLGGPLLAYLNTLIAQNIVDHESIYLSLGVLLASLVVIAICNSLQTTSHTYYQKHLTLNLQNKILNYIYRLKDYSALNVGENFAQIDQNAEAYCATKIEILKKTVRAICLLTFSGIYISRLSLSLLAFSYLFTGAIIVLNYFTAAHIEATSKAFTEKNNEMTKYCWEMINNSEIASTLVDDKILKKFFELNQQVYHLNISLNRKKLFSRLTKRFGYLIVLVAVSIFGGLLALNQVFTLAELFGVIVLLPRLTNAIFDLPVVLTDYSSNRGLKKSIDSIFTQDQYVDSDKVELKESISKISCSDISFSYSDKILLQRFTFQFHQTAVHLITGASGSGKSTLLRLICRSLYPKSGAIYINSIPLDTISRESLWKLVFYAPQNCAIFPTTLRKNITCNQADNPEKIYRCLNGVNLNPFRIGLDDIVDIETLSAGEKQKIVFARALYCNSDVLIMDEPTSAMDPASEERCLASLREKAHGENLIVIIVSHNSACEKFADVICNLSNGKLEGIVK